MRTKVLAGLVAVAVLSVGGAAWAYTAMARNCCYPGSDCCYLGSPCCDDAAATGETKQVDCCADPSCPPGCSPDCPPNCAPAAAEAKPAAAPKCDGGKCCGTTCKD